MMRRRIVNVNTNSRFPINNHRLNRIRVSRGGTRL